MSTRKLYNQWSSTYDTVENKTRDLEKAAGQQVLSAIPFASILELGCGTGKNTEWLSPKAGYLQAVDLSEEMMARAREKVNASHVEFLQADITKPWEFVNRPPDLVTCSLILEHIEDLCFIFQQAANVLLPRGHFYLCELHPYKQYSGSKARFETTEGLQVLECFVHHASDYYGAAISAGFSCVAFEEWFDEGDRANPPRLLSFLFRKG
jgi:ubiquinone/menaquinone biosynthesis C-methylase UbiE